jgi:hypothetical protein
LVFFFDLLIDLIARLLGWSWLDRETQRADLTAADLVVRFSVAGGVAVVLIWFAFRFFA